MTDRFLGIVLAVAFAVVVSTFLGPAVGAAPHAPTAVADSGAPTFLPAAAPTVTPPGGGAPPASILTGGVPDAILVDPANDSAFVASQLGGNVTVIALDSHQILYTIPVGTQPAPQAIALDPTNWTVYVANAGSANVSVISIAYDYVIGSIPVGASPDCIVVNSGNHDVYVADGGSGTVTIISPATTIPHVIATVPVGPDPDALAVDTVTHNVFVATAGNGNVSVISAVTNTVIHQTSVGTAPGPFGAMVFDPANQNVYVANLGSNNVSVIGGNNGTAYAQIPVGTGPTAMAFDAAAKKLFVVNHYSDNVSVISTKNNTLVGTVAVGSQPSTDGAIAFNPALGTVYVPNGGSNSVSVVSATSLSVVATVSVGSLPDAVGADSANGEVYVANQGSSNVSEFAVSAVTFHASGLPAATPWSITSGTPPVVRANTTTAHKKGTITFDTTRLTLAYSIAPPAGYAVAKVSGPRSPSQTLVTLAAKPSTFTVVFGPLEPLTITETGLPPGTLWGLTLTSALHFGGPTAQTATSNTTSVEFTAVKGTYHYTLSTGPATFRLVPAHGTVSVGTHPAAKTIKFKPVTETVVFEVVGLTHGTTWQVNVTGPMNVTLGSVGGAIRMQLINGTYHYTVSNLTSLHPHPASGTLVILAPHPTLVVIITYTSIPAHAQVGFAPAVAATRPVTSARTAAS